MKLFPEDNEIVLYETGFENDILDRKTISEQLSELLERIDDPIVVALDDMWGSGKTFFLKRWVSAHQNENGGSAVTVYFDAFENDYLSDPLVSIITAVSERIPKDQATTLEKWKSAATKLAKPTFGIALSLATFGAKQHLEEIGDVLADALSAEVKDAASDLWVAEKERKESIVAFKRLLVELTEGEAASIIIVIDELDRCRPDYALSVLEVIKHFFAVPKVHFIIGVNGSALENSVKARYGADIDAESYLRKFINISFSLPRAAGNRGEGKVIELYAEKLIADMELPEKISKRCVDLLNYVSTNKDVSLRDVGKVLSKIPLLPKKARDEGLLVGWSHITCVLLVSSVIDPKFHKKLLSAKATAEEIRYFLGASQSKTVDQLEGGNHNPNYIHELTIWFAEVLFCCSLEELTDVTDLPAWCREIGKNFDRYGIHREPKSIPSIIQRDWVDVFRV